MTVRWSALRRRGLLHLIAGLLAGRAGAAGLFRMGAITLSSPMWVYLPLLISTLWVALRTTPYPDQAVSPAPTGGIAPLIGAATSCARSGPARRPPSGAKPPVRTTMSHEGPEYGHAGLGVSRAKSPPRRPRRTTGRDHGWCAPATTTERVLTATGQP